VSRPLHNPIASRFLLARDSTPTPRARVPAVPPKQSTADPAPPPPRARVRAPPLCPPPPPPPPLRVFIEGSILSFKSLPLVSTVPFLLGTRKTIQYTAEGNQTTTYTAKSDGTYSGFGSSTTWVAPWDSYEFVGGTFDSACMEKSGLVSVVEGWWEQDTGSTGEVMPVYLSCTYAEYGISDDLSKQGEKSKKSFTPPLAEVSAAVAFGGAYKCPRTPPPETTKAVTSRFVCVEGCGLQARCGSPNTLDAATINGIDAAATAVMLMGGMYNAYFAVF